MYCRYHIVFGDTLNIHFLLTMTITVALSPTGARPYANKKRSFTLMWLNILGYINIDIVLQPLNKCYFKQIGRWAARWFLCYWWVHFIIAITVHGMRRIISWNRQKAQPVSSILLRSPQRMKWALVNNGFYDSLLLRIHTKGYATIKKVRKY